jgi:hypothetical protein
MYFFVIRSEINAQKMVIFLLSNVQLQLILLVNSSCKDYIGNQIFMLI